MKAHVYTYMRVCVYIYAERRAFLRGRKLRSRNDKGDVLRTRARVYRYIPAHRCVYVYISIRSRNMDFSDRPELSHERMSHKRNASAVRLRSYRAAGIFPRIFD